MPHGTPLFCISLSLHYITKSIKEIYERWSKKKFKTFKSLASWQKILILNQWWEYVYLKRTDPYTYLRRTWFYISFHKKKTFYVRLKNIYNLSFLLKNVRWIFKEIYTRISFHNGSLKTDPCWYLFKYSFDVLKKKTNVLDIFNTDKKCFINITFWIPITVLSVINFNTMLSYNH